MGKRVGFRFGIQPGIGIVSIDYNKLLFGDQIARGGNVPTVEVPSQTKTFFDIGAGALIYSEKYWLGTSFFHLNTPNQSLTGNADGILPIKYTVHGGAKFYINKDEKEEIKKKSISGVFYYRGQKEFSQLDLGVYYTRYVFSLGLWYRGIPWFKAYKKGYSNNDAVAIVAGVKTKRMSIGYSYDYTISKLAFLTNGAHEVTLAYQICKPNKKKKYKLLIPCPKF
jgi:type IX secretion system PorP/SprF family membrane protein